MHSQSVQCIPISNQDVRVDKLADYSEKNQICELIILKREELTKNKNFESNFWDKPCRQFHQKKFLNLKTFVKFVKITIEIKIYIFKIFGVLSASIWNGTISNCGLHCSHPHISNTIPYDCSLCFIYFTFTNFTFSYALIIQDLSTMQKFWLTLNRSLFIYFLLLKMQN